MIGEKGPVAVPRDSLGRQKAEGFTAVLFGVYRL